MLNLFSRFRFREAFWIRFFDRVIMGCFFLVIILVPLVFVPSLLDSLELPKQTLLVILTAVAGIAWCGKILCERKVIFFYNWLHVAVGFLLFGFLIISLVSQDRFLSLIGMSGQMSWAWMTLAACAFWYVMAGHYLRSLEQVQRILMTVLAVSSVAGLFGLVQILRADVTTSVGNVYGLAMYLIVPLLMASVLFSSKVRFSKPFQAILWSSFIISLILLILVNLRSSWVVIFSAAVFLVIFSLYHHHGRLSLQLFIVPLALMVLSLGFIFVPAPFHLSLAPEISPSVSASFEIARGTLQNHPLFGSGPGTWVFDYAKYHQSAVNASLFWNNRFDRGFSSWLTLLPTVGLIGMWLWVAFLLAVLIKSGVHAVREKSTEERAMKSAIFFGLLTTVLIMIVYHDSISQQFLFWILLGLFGSLATHHSWKWDFHRSGWKRGVASGILCIKILFGFIIIWLIGQRFIADILLVHAIRQYQSKPLIEVAINELGQARKLNPWNELILRNLSQAHLVQATNLMQGSATNTQAEIQREITQSLDLAAELTRKHPANVENWIQRGNLYQVLVPTMRGADQFAITFYQQAEMLEPTNPTIFTEKGKVYLMRADVYRGLVNTSDQKMRAATQKYISENLFLAREAFVHAIGLKSDYLPAHYYLGVVDEREGKLKEAIAELERVLQLNNKDEGVAFELALLYARQGEKPRALDLLQQIVKVDPNNANARWYLAFLYEEAGAIDTAIQHVQTLATQFPDNAVIQERLQALITQRQSKIVTKPALPEPLPEGTKNQINVKRKSKPATR
ncbi:tetratricopeptide repeat protein [Candidatus Uhrbacteria bacterium]|nr:tetratricopeptide repeat protein [Candidatus Uhrbacteria bacterium]